MAGVYEVVSPILRGKRFHLRRRVPDKFAFVEPRKEVWLSLETDSPTEALKRAVIAWDQQVARWQLLVANGAPADAQDAGRTQFDAAVSLASAHGWTYQTAEQLAAGEMQPLLARLEALEAATRGRSDPALVAALAGGAARPQHMISDLPKLYEQVMRPKLVNKNETQLRKWRNPFLRAVKQFIAVCGDKPALDVTSADARLLRADFRRLVADGDILADTANKSLGFLRTMIRAHCDEQDATDPLAFAGMRVSGGPSEPRDVPEFSEDWIETVIRAPGPLAKLNSEARSILVIMESTGCRPSEIYNIGPSSIHLDAPAPFLRLEEIGRKLKNPASRRDVPLVGQALAAVRTHPDGFPRYRGKDSFSATINKFLRNAGVMPSPDHTAYSLRHSFEGRMKRAGIDIADRAAMMGHSRQNKTGREEYGDDPTLGEKVQILRRMGIPGA